MSRTWKRAIKKNTMAANRYRRQTGQQLLQINHVEHQSSENFKGRSVMLSILVLMTGVFCFIVFPSTPENQLMYWFTGGSYLLLAAFIFYLRRPFLRVEKNQLVTSRFGGERRVQSEQINWIRYQRDAVTIQVDVDHKVSTWVFSKNIQLMDITSMQRSLTMFAERNQIPIEKIDQTGEVMTK